MEPTEKVTRGLIFTIATALITAVLSLSVNLFLAANQYRAAAKRDEVARLTRQVNLLLLLRDELGRIQGGLEHGNFQIKVNDGMIQSGGYEYPQEIWQNLKWNFELLNVDPSLVQLIASMYAEVAHAESLRATAGGVQSVMGDYMESILRGEGATEEQLQKARSSSPQLRNNLKSYNEAQERLRQQLPGTLAALDIKINELRSRLPR